MITFLKKNEYGIRILGLSIGRFSFDWFTELGEWFIYVYHFGRKSTRVLRLSSAGCFWERYESGRNEG